jgi:4,4'-diaponeurosporenoate glycosyltransferase
VAQVGWFVVGAMFAGVVAFGRPRLLPRSTTRDPVRRPHTVVIIPARNEQTKLPGLLTDLTARASGADRIVVADDDSDDDTFGVAAGFEGVEVHRVAGRPGGWGGKQWACEEGVARIGGEDPSTVLVFLDADVRVDRGGIESLVAARARVGGVVSVQPRHEVRTWTEQLSAFFNIVAVMGIAAGTRRPTGIFGPVVCCTLGDYRAVGGHAAVRTEVVEDLALGRRFREADIPVRVFVGGLFRFRMYPDGWSSLREGWSKNIATGAASTPAWRAVLVGWWISGLLVACRNLATAAVTGVAPGPALVAYGLTVVTVAVLARRVGSFRFGALVAYPALLAGFLGLFAVSTWCSFVRRSVTWKGRSVPTGRVARRVEPHPGTRP